MEPEVTNGGEVSIAERAFAWRCDAGRYRAQARAEPELENQQALLCLADWSQGKADVLTKLARYGRGYAVGTAGAGFSREVGS